MSDPAENGKQQPPGHQTGNRIELVDENPSPRLEGETSSSLALRPRPQREASLGLRDSKGWDGKLRVPKSASLANPEALSDPDYSDDEHVVRGPEVAADEDLLDEENLESEEILCTHMRIKSIPALRLERFQNLGRLGMRQNLIEEIEGLSPLGPKLEDLDLYDNLIKHIRGLDDLVNLITLDLSFNKIKHIKNVNHLKNLHELFFTANKISVIENLDGLDKLENLELGSNRIRELKNLDGLPALEDLWVAKNKITELHGLGGLPKLRLLSIQSNRIRDLTPLKDVPQLEELYISHNALESLEGLENCTRLKVLDISNNKVVSLKGMGPLKDLEEFWAGYNMIADFAEVERELADKSSLETVYFEGNPLQLKGPAVYRNKVRLALPQLVQIDASELGRV